MKANEIQIGDWLYYKGQFNAFPFKVESITKKKVGYHAEPNEHRIYYLRLSECKPIPLTPEILEKNGWVYIAEDKVFYTENLKNKLRWIYYITDGSNEVFRMQDFCKLQYVHELQHALRLYGIEKEIVL